MNSNINHYILTAHLRRPTRWKSTKFSNFIFFAQSIRLFLLFNMVWQPLPCDNGKYFWQGYKGEPIVVRAASAVTALHSTSKLVSTNHSIFFPYLVSIISPWGPKGPIRRSSLTRQVASLTRPKAILDESDSQ